MEHLAAQPYTPSWVDLPGVVNMRDLGGIRTRQGEQLRPRTLLRSDNLVDLTAESVRVLREEYGLSDVIDLRTNRERLHSGPAPVDELVSVHALSLYPDDDPQAELPPWHGVMALADQLDADARAARLAEHYLGYLRGRPDNIRAALDVIAAAPGAVIICCAAGKDRTGTVSAVALGALDVPDRTIIADYAASNDRVEEILIRLGQAAAAGSSEHQLRAAAQSTPPEIMRLMLQAVEEQFGTMQGWLESTGWSAREQDALSARLLT